MTSAILNRTIARILPRAAGGDGCYILDEDGRRYLDASGGAAVSCLGHSHAAVIAAIARQASEIAYVHSGYFTTDAAERLALALVDAWPEAGARALFVSSGSEAVEAAIKLARQYHLERGEPDRRLIVSRRQSYHGNTLGALAASGNAGRREAYSPYLFEASRVSPCYPYREQREGDTDADYVARLAIELDAEFTRLGSGNVSAFLAETVCGATLGSQPAVEGYFRHVREVCDRHGALLILDEVMCGMGRTGTLYAFEQEGIIPDIVTCAKGLAAGYQPIGALVVRERVVHALADGSGSLRHGHTYMAHPIACAAALAVQDAIRDENLLANVTLQGDRLARRLKDRFGQHPHVGDIRGRGLLFAIELVTDRPTKAPFAPSAKVADRIRSAAFERGLICYPSSGTIDGINGDHVLLAPPYIATADDIETIIQLLDLAMADVLPTAAH